MAGYDPNDVGGMLERLARQREADTATAQRAMGIESSSPSVQPQAPTPAPSEPSPSVSPPAARPGIIGSLRSAANSGIGKTVGALATAGAISQAADEGSNDKYAQRFGFEPTGDGSIGDIMKYAALRGLGFASDLGNNLSGGIIGKYFFRDQQQPNTDYSAAMQSAIAAGPKIIQSTTLPGNPPTSTVSPTQQPNTNQGYAQSSVSGAPGIFKLTKDGANPIYTDSPIRALADQQSNAIGIVPGMTPQQLSAAKNELRGAFLRSVNSGDLEGARQIGASGLMSPQDMALLGAAERQYVEERNARSATESADSQRDALQRSLMPTIQSLANSGNLVGGKNEAAKLQSLSGIVSSLANRPQSNAQPRNYIQELAAQQGAGQQAASAELANEVTRGNLAQQKELDALRQQILKEPDQAKRKSLYDTYMALSGKAPQQDKVAIIDVDTGQKDLMGQPIYKKAAVNTVTGDVLGSPAPDRPKLTADQATAQAKAAIASGANKDAVNQRLKEMGFGPV